MQESKKKKTDRSAGSPRNPDRRALVNRKSTGNRAGSAQPSVTIAKRRGRGKTEGQKILREWSRLQDLAARSDIPALSAAFRKMGASLEKMTRDQEALRLSAEKFFNIFRSGPLWMTISALGDGRYLEVNDTFLRITGFKRAEVIGKTTVELGLWQSAAERSRMIELFKTQGFLRDVEVIFYTKAGKPRNCLWFAEGITLEDKPYLLSVALDMTEQKRMEDQVRQSQERFRTLARISPVGIFRTDTAGRCRYVNERWTAITGVPFEKIEGRLWYHFLNPRDRSPVAKEWKAATTGGILFNTEGRLGKVGNRDTWVLGNIIPEKNGDGQVVGYVGTITDITPFKRTEKALRETERRFRQIFEHATEGIYQTTLKGRLVNINRTAVRMLGYEEPEEFKATIKDIKNQIYVNPGDRARLLSLLYKNGFLRNYEVLWRHRDGHLIWVSVNGRLVRDDRGRILFHEGTCRDITARKYAEEELKKSEEKLRFLSNQLIMAQEKERKRIAIELHDELGQSLMGLKFQLSGFPRKLKSDPEALEKDISLALKQIDTMTRNIRRITQDLHPTMLEHLGLDEALQWLVSESSSHFKVHYLNALGDFNGSFSKEQEVIIFRILQESLNNIRKHAKARKVSILTTIQGNQALFLIKDDGQGFDRRTIVGRAPSRIGLGLTSMEERARMAGGNFKINSQPGIGTAITFKVPFQK
jgi:PAS domain S-box-containing protein